MIPFLDRVKGEYRFNKVKRKRIPLIRRPNPQTHLSLAKATYLVLLKLCQYSTVLFFSVFL